MEHELKIWPQYYARVADGSKTFEVRENDRGFQPGDTVILREWNPEIVTHPNTGWGQLPDEQGPVGYTGNAIKFKVGYVLPIDDKRVVFSLLPEVKNERP